MAHCTPGTPTAEQLGEELRALHDRRELAPLPAADELRYAELWAWWQAGGDASALESAPDGAGEEAPAGSAGEHAAGIGGAADEVAAPAAAVPQEWLTAFDGDREGELPSAPFARAAEPAHPDDDLAKEWEVWQAQQSSGDPFALMPEDAGPSYDEVMQAREAVLAFEKETSTGPGESAAPFGESLDAAESSPPVPPEPVPVAPVTLVRGPTVPGSRRVVIHLADGQVRRGTVVDAALSGSSFSYVTAAGATESLARADVRTVFIMRPAGAAAEAGSGAPVHVTLRDGRELSGRSEDHASGGDALTLVPDDPRSTAALVWIARSAVRSVTVTG